MTVSDATTLAIGSAATLNGDVTLNGVSTVSIGGTLNGNIVNNGGGLVALTGSAKATSTITNNGTLYGQIENGQLLGGSSLDFSAATQTAIGSFAFDASSSIVLGHEIDHYSAWSNAGSVTFANERLFRLFQHDNPGHHEHRNAHRARQACICRDLRDRNLSRSTTVAQFQFRVTGKM